MAVLDYILLGIIILGLGLILIVVVRKFPVVSSINTKMVAKNQQKNKKKDLIEQRLIRKFNNLFKKSGRFFLPIRQKTTQFFQDTHKKLSELEKQYSQKIQRPKNNEEKMAAKNKVEILLQEAEDLRKQEKLKEAEKKYIEAISLDKHNLVAFERLGELYLAMKEFDFAHETFSHLLLIDPANALVYHDLGLLAKLQGNAKLAIKNFQKSLTIEPSNPKIIDSLLETCLECKDKVIAWECLDKLKQVNPDNQKIEEFENRVKALEKELKIKK